MEVMPSCQKAIDKACKSNPILRKILRRKMNEIVFNPPHYKPLKYDLAGERRIQIGSFVLVYEINYSKKLIIFTRFTHHDKAYRR